MAIVMPIGGETASQTIKRQPPEELSSAIFGWGGFVNFVDGSNAGTVENVFNTGLGQDRTEYPVGNPGETHESWALGRIKANPVVIDCWMSKRPNAGNSQIRLLDAHEGDETLQFGRWTRRSICVPIQCQSKELQP